MYFIYFLVIFLIGIIIFSLTPAGKKFNNNGKHLDAPSDDFINSVKIQEGALFYKYGTLLGLSILFGPLVGIYMLYKNFLGMGKEKLANNFITIALILVIGVFYFIAHMVNKGIKPGFSLVIFYVVIFGFIYNKYQKSILENYFKNGGKTYSVLNILLVILLSLLLIFIIAGTFIFLGV